MSGETASEFFTSFREGDELKATQLARDRLRGAAWARLLLKRLGDDLQAAKRSLRFETRFAAEILRVGVRAEYEFQAGVGNSSVDFRLNGSTTWLIEIVSIEASDAARRICRTDGVIHSYEFTSMASDPRSSEEGEMVRVSEKIAEKARKFPEPTRGVFHLIVADMRGYLLQGGGDRYDCRQIAYGPSQVVPEFVHYWQGMPIRGIFEAGHPSEASAVARERIHFIGFINEERYSEGELRNVRCCYYLPNPLLLTNEDAIRVFKEFPLRPSRGRGGNLQ